MLSDYKITEFFYMADDFCKFFLKLSNITGREGISKKKSSSLWLFLIMRKEAPKKLKFYNSLNYGHIVSKTGQHIMLVEL